MSSEWTTIESDPGVFNELMQMLGIEALGCEEVYSLDDLVANDSTSYGLIFLFKWRQEDDNRPQLDSSNIPDLFFARQMITNACATQALLSILLNLDESLTLPPLLSNLKEFTNSLDPETRGIAIGNSDDIRIAHNSFARPEPIIQDEQKRGLKSVADAYHFIAYIPFGTNVYEIDGMKSGPIDLGEITEGTWLDVVKPSIESRMQRYSQSETHFNLLSICPKKSIIIEKKILDLEGRLRHLDLSISDESTANLNRETDLLVYQDSLTSLEKLRYELTEEMEKSKRESLENARRRHNYIPFTITLLNVLARKQLLSNLRKVADDKVKSRISQVSGFK